jgi:hypothetical protein
METKKESNASIGENVDGKKLETIDYEKFYVAYNEYAENNIKGLFSAIYKIFGNGFYTRIGTMLIAELLKHGIGDYFNKVNDWLHDRTDNYTNKIYGDFNTLLMGSDNVKYDGFPCGFIENILKDNATCTMRTLLIIANDSDFICSDYFEFIEKLSGVIQSGLGETKSDFIKCIVEHNKVCSKSGLREYRKNPFSIGELKFSTIPADNNAVHATVHFVNKDVDMVDSTVLSSNDSTNTKVEK